MQGKHLSIRILSVNIGIRLILYDGRSKSRY